MAEVLSQSQIDALLNSLQGSDETIDEIDKKASDAKYRKYDFYSPKKFTKDKLKILKSIFDNYSRMAGSQINGLFRTSSELSVITVEEQRYYEFANALNDNDILTIVNVTVPNISQSPPLLINASMSLMLSLIDRMLGGVGEEADIDEYYTYTEIEMALYRKVIQYLIGALKDSWSSYINLNFKLDRLEENPGMFQEIGVDETIVIVVIDVDLKECTGRLNVCIPGTLLLNIFEIMEKKKHNALGDELRSQDNRNDIFSSIKSSDLLVQAKVGDAVITLDDIYNLHVGDVINLNTPKESDIQLYVESQPWFKGQLGVHKRNVAVQIDDLIEKGNYQTGEN
ncbi:flagellar motor switch protein FliM [Lacrimispora algidixylanolytica]|uniref:Flagellar motor switch protein FliM n=1 Tax=Lacrimispora algidixylanolytica TaxID=94868 RepID=A0A419T645_9FIRM|nr:FliM/FliN family flagellar motor switch protein [Lacrimispora algidixylanolytica]RKD33024.1 flagellar motor switch protein FliM [Lacrimispora algidixylanolytica]